MATRSRIAIKNEDGTLTSVYCHWDGYPDGVGETLMKHYTTEEKVRELLALGDISSLGETLDFESTRDYNRWRNEKTKAQEHHSEFFLNSSAKNCGANFVYIFKNNQWFIIKPAS